MQVTEKLIQYIFQFKLFNQSLFTIDEQDVNILSVGIKNENAGPDFLEAKIQINNLVIAGHIEIDLKTSDWKKHKHHLSADYKNVILHIVWEHDSHPEHSFIPILEFKNFVAKTLLNKYHALMQNHKNILCSDFLIQQTIPNLILSHWQERLLIERLEQKTENIKLYLQKTNYNWEQSFFILLIKNFGYTANALVFEDIGFKTDIRLFAKNKNSLESILAILFGQANLFSDDNYKHRDEFSEKLKIHYLYFKHKCNLTSSTLRLLFSKMRPANLPSVRLAQMASLIYKSTHLFSKILETETLKNLTSLFEINIHPYFENHFILGKSSTQKSLKKISNTFIHNLVINTVIPIIFLYGEIHKNDALKHKALKWIEQIPAEQNNISTQWQQLNIKISNAGESQAMINLYKDYCQKQRCLECQIGFYFLKSN